MQALATTTLPPFSSLSVSMPAPNGDEQKEELQAAQHPKASVSTQRFHLLTTLRESLNSLSSFDAAAPTSMSMTKVATAISALLEEGDFFLKGYPSCPHLKELRTSLGALSIKLNSLHSFSNDFIASTTKGLSSTSLNGASIRLLKQAIAISLSETKGQLSSLRELLPKIVQWKNTRHVRSASSGESPPIFLGMRFEGLAQLLVESPLLQPGRKTSEERTPHTIATIIDHHHQNHSTYVLTAARSIIGPDGREYHFQGDLPALPDDPSKAAELTIQLPLYSGRATIPCRWGRVPSSVSAYDTEGVGIPLLRGDAFSVRILPNIDGTYRVLNLPPQTCSLKVSYSTSPNPHSQVEILRNSIEGLSPTGIALDNSIATQLQHISSNSNLSDAERAHCAMTNFISQDWVYSDNTALNQLLNSLPPHIINSFLAGLRVGNCKWQSRFFHSMLQQVHVPSVMESGPICTPGSNQFKAPGHSVVRCLLSTPLFLDPTLRNNRSLSLRPDISSQLNEIREVLMTADPVTAYGIGHKLRLSGVVKTSITAENITADPEHRSTIEESGHGIVDDYNSHVALPKDVASLDGRQFIPWLEETFGENSTVHTTDEIRSTLFRNDTFIEFVEHAESNPNNLNLNEVDRFFLRLIPKLVLTDGLPETKKELGRNLHYVLLRHIRSESSDYAERYHKLFVQEALDPDVLRELAPAYLEAVDSCEKTSMLTQLNNVAIESLRQLPTMHLKELLLYTYTQALEDDEESPGLASLDKNTFDPLTLLDPLSRIPSGGRPSFHAPDIWKRLSTLHTLLGEEANPHIIARLETAGLHVLGKLTSHEYLTQFGWNLTALQQHVKEHPVLSQVVNRVAQSFYERVVGHIHQLDDTIDAFARAIESSDRTLALPKTAESTYANCSSILGDLLKRGVILQRVSREEECKLREKVDLLSLLHKRVFGIRDHQYHDFFGNEYPHNLSFQSFIALALAIPLAEQDFPERETLFALAESGVIPAEVLLHMQRSVERSPMLADDILRLVTESKRDIRLLRGLTGSPHKKLCTVLLRRYIEATFASNREELRGLCRREMLTTLYLDLLSGRINSPEASLAEQNALPEYWQNQSVGTSAEQRIALKYLFMRERDSLVADWGPEIPELLSRILKQSQKTTRRNLMHGLLAHFQYDNKETDLNRHKKSSWEKMVTDDSQENDSDTLAPTGVDYNTLSSRGNSTTIRSCDVSQLSGYQQGDAINSIDWRASARRDSLLVRRYDPSVATQGNQVELVLDLGLLILSCGLSDHVPQQVFGYINKLLQAGKKPTLALYFHGALIQRIPHSVLLEWKKNKYCAPLAELPLIQQAMALRMHPSSILPHHSNWFEGPMDRDETILLLDLVERMKASVVVFAESATDPYCSNHEIQFLKRALTPKGRIQIQYI